MLSDDAATWVILGPATIAGLEIASFDGSFLIKVGFPLNVWNCAGGSTSAAMIHDCGPTGLTKMASQPICFSHCLTVSGGHPNGSGVTLYTSLFATVAGTGSSGFNVFQLSSYCCACTRMPYVTLFRTNPYGCVNFERSLSASSRVPSVLIGQESQTIFQSWSGNPLYDLGVA